MHVYYHMNVYYHMTDKLQDVLTAMQVSGSRKIFIDKLLVRIHLIIEMI